MKEEFKIYSPLTRKSVKAFTKNDDGETDSERILLEGIASTTSRDLHDEIVASAAIESMSEQALNLNLHGDHWYGLEDVIGAIKDASVEDKQLKIKFLITKKYTPDIKDLLETGVRLGLSIGGYVTSYDEKNRIINAIELHEISLTAMPANWDTFGTVTTSKGLIESNCVTGACHAIVKKLEVEKMAKTETFKEEPGASEEEVTGLTKDEVIELINEYMAEKEETISQEITDKVESKLDSLVEAKVQELLDESKEPSEPAEETEENKAVEDEEEKPQEEEEEEEETKSFNPDDITKAIKEGIANAIGENFVDQVATKMFGELEHNRTNESSKFKQYQKQLGENPEEEPKVDDGKYSSKTAAEFLIKKQVKANPIMAAAMKNLE